MSRDALRILVLAGGPDAERPVSFQSGSAVSAALEHAGHDVHQRDITPDDLSALSMFDQWQGDVIFPVLHGAWGEGGGLQRLLDERQLPYVGSVAGAAALCMDKHATKRELERAGIATPAYERLQPGESPTLEPPAVVKPAREGSSIALSICRETHAIKKAVDDLQADYQSILVERYTTGREITVGVLELSDTQHNDATTAPIALPPLEITPAAEYYDYDAKYERDDTRYSFDLDLPGETLERLKRDALTAYRTLGVRHLARVDFIVDHANEPWLLEVNTLPGFTDHSLLPMAAQHLAISMPELCDRLARAAHAARLPQP